MSWAPNCWVFVLSGGLCLADACWDDARKHFRSPGNVAFGSCPFSCNGIKSFFFFFLQIHFLRSGGLPCVMTMLTKIDFLQDADIITRRWVGKLLSLLEFTSPQELARKIVVQV